MKYFPLRTKYDSTSLFCADVPCKEIDFGPVWGMSNKRLIYFYAINPDEARDFLSQLGVGETEVWGVLS